MESGSQYWPISAVATTLVCIGYVPEFIRLYVERTSSGTGIYMWLLWIGSAMLSTLYALLSGASVLIIVNSTTLTVLTFGAALGNTYFCLFRPVPAHPTTELTVRSQANA
jgi:hypothetical protein